MRRALASLLLLLVGGVASWLTFDGLRTQERSNAQNLFRRAATARSASIRHQIDSSLEVLGALAAFYGASQSVERDEFRRFATSRLDSYRQVRMLGWAEREVDDDGRPVSWLTYAEPEAPYQGALGTELGTLRGFIAAAAESARDGQPIAIPMPRPIDLPGDSELLVVLALERSSELGAAHRDGLLVLALDLDRLVEDAQAYAGHGGLATEIVDAASSLEARRRGSEANAGGSGGEIEHVTSVEIGGRQLLIRQTPLPGEFAARIPWHAWAVLAIGFGLTALAVLYLHLTHRRSAELSASNAALSEEIVVRERAERGLHLFRTIIDRSGEMISVFSPETGKLHYANERASEGFGHAIEALKSMIFADLVTDLPQSKSWPAWQRWMRELEDEHFAIVEATHLRSDGVAYPVELHLTYLRHEDRGFLVCAAEDITDRLRREADLQSSRDELARLSRLDGLLEVANRRHFDEMLEAHWETAVARHTPLSLILADIDHFKDYNDSYGHLAGDQCLKAVVREISNLVYRPTDLVARYGGEELAVLLPGTELRGARVVAENLRHGVQALGIRHEGSAVGSLTISLGVGTAWPGQLKSPADLITRADRALYRAKTLGRNRVESAQLDAGGLRQRQSDDDDAS